jgi:predicted DCC family thiol-disulfide oxidoreductase YuxK
MKNRNEYSPASREVLIYDGACPICSGTAKWIQDNAMDGSFDMIPCQSLQEGVQYPRIKLEDCMQSMHVVLPDGTVLAGEKALPEIIARLRKYRFAGFLFKLPGAESLSRIAYRWFANRRYRISALLSRLTENRRR